MKEYRDNEREKIRLSRLSKQEGSFYVEDEPKLAFGMFLQCCMFHSVHTNIFAC